MSFKSGDRVRLTARAIELAWDEGTPRSEAAVCGTVVGVDKWNCTEVSFDDGSTHGLRDEHLRHLSIVEELARLA